MTNPLPFPSFAEFAVAVEAGTQPPEQLDPRLRALWLGRQPGGWDAAHDIVNALGSHDGDAIHAWLHLVEGDIGNAAYWFSRARLKPVGPQEADTLWKQLATTMGGWAD